VVHFVSRGQIKGNIASIGRDMDFFCTNGFVFSSLKKSEKDQEGSSVFTVIIDVVCE
jgi:hypothetical protein